MVFASFHGKHNIRVVPRYEIDACVTKVQTAYACFHTILRKIKASKRLTRGDRRDIVASELSDARVKLHEERQRL